MAQQPTPYQAPDFSLIGSDGARHQLTDYAGSWLVLYFYPKDDTPGCTTQACSMRDERDEIAKLGAQVVGVSRDTPDVHERFKAKYSLNFTLLSDPRAEVHQLYGAWGKKMFGHEGALRKTFLIDPSGVVQKVYGRAVPLGHGEKILEDLRALQQT